MNSLIALWLPRAAWFTRHSVSTALPDAAYPLLQPLSSRLTPQALYELARKVAARIPRWRVAREEPEALRCTLLVTTAIPLYRDELQYWVEEAPGGSILHVSSRSRCGGGDLGENARHVEALLSRMRQALQ